MQTDGEFLVKIGGWLRRLPNVEQSQCVLQGGEFGAALGARIHMSPSSAVGWRCWIQKEVRKNGFAVAADHFATLSIFVKRVATVK